jgi:hypothetical protein
MGILNTILPNSNKVAKLKPPRLVIYAKDIQLITGKSHRSCQILLQQIRIALGKTRHQFVTFPEFCQYTKMDEDTVYAFLASKSR